MTPQHKGGWHYGSTGRRIFWLLCLALWAQPTSGHAQEAGGETDIPMPGDDTDTHCRITLRIKIN